MVSMEFTLPSNPTESILIRVPYDRIYGKAFSEVCLLSDKLAMSTDALNDLAVNMLDSIKYSGEHYIHDTVYEICEALYEDPDTGDVEDVTEYAMLGGVLTCVGQQAKGLLRLLPQLNIEEYNLAYVCTKDEDLFFVAMREAYDDD